MLKRFFGRMRGRGKAPPRYGLDWMLWSWLGAVLGIVAAATVNRTLNLDPIAQILLVGSFGASAVLLYGAPQVPMAQPRNLIIGHLVSALCGVAATRYLDLPVEFVAGIAVGSAILFMQLSRSLHPPGGATALIAVIGGEQIHTAGFGYALHPILSGASAMLLVALLVNNLSNDPERHYPRFWY